MKILFSINCFRGGGHATNDGGLIWPAAWGRFLERNESRLNHDFCFLNAGFDPERFREVTLGFEVQEFPYAYDPSDTDATYECLAKNPGYDYVARVDPDMFPSVEALNAMTDFLEGNPDIDLLSPACARQGFHTGPYPVPGPDNNWAPWGEPTVGDCIVFFRREHFMECCREYDAHPLLNAGSPPRPFSTYELTYGQVCDWLGVEYPDEWADASVGLDGQIGSDFWAAMCKVGIKHGDIVNYDNRSFGLKNHIHAFDDAMKFPSLEKVVDGADISRDGCGERVIAPFLHTGMSYNSYWHFNAFDSPPGLGPEHEAAFLESFYGGEDFRALAALNVIVQMLLEPMSDDSLMDDLKRTRAEALAQVGIDGEEFEGFYKRVSDFYYPTLEEYL